MRGITKRYPGVVANDDIDLDVRPGEIHALLGENGAGKSTLMNILYGLATPDEGEILLDGTAVTINGPSDAIARGISMVHQHFMLVPVLTVAENILLGEETMANPIFLDRTEARRRIIELGKRFGFEIDPDVKVGTLSVGWQQRVEILKALYRDARILVLDEPTAVLTPQETKEIFAVLRRLAAEGHSIIFISHKLYEVLEIADRITVIRRGKVVGARMPAETDEDDLAELMVGRDVQLVVDRGESPPGEPGARRSTDLQRRATTAATRPSRASASTSAPARSSASPASPATARTSSSRRSPGCASRRAGTVDARRQGHHRRRAARAPATPGMSLRARRPPPLRAGAQLPARRQPRPHPLLPGARTPAGLLRERRRDPTHGRSGRSSEYDIRTPSPTVPRRHAVGRQPAEGRSSPASSAGT